jgi:hypothetical protein
MERIKKFIVLLFSVSLLFLCGCAKNYNDAILHKTTSFWSGSPVVALDIPYPEPMSFELPSAEWVPLKSKKQEGVATRVELAEGGADSYVKLAIEGQTKELFESLETQSGVDFGQTDSLVLLGLFDHYKKMTQTENADKPIKYGETKFASQGGDAYAWMVTSNGSFGIAYAVLKTKNNNYFTIEVNQKNRATDIEKILTDIVKSHKTY